MKKLCITPFFLILAACTLTSNPNTQPTVAEAESRQQDEQVVTETDLKYYEMLKAGKKEISHGNPLGAIENYFDPIIDDFEKTYGDSDQRVYSSRTQIEAILYLLMAARDKVDAVVISSVWSEAFYYKGYASLDLGRVEEAAFWVGKALDLSPSNAVYLSESGHIHNLNKRWSKALELYEEAVTSAQEFSPEEKKDKEQLVALRGLGYSLIELGRLDEAEATFNKCLKINAKDQKSKNELAYIENLRKEQANERAEP